MDNGNALRRGDVEAGGESAGGSIAWIMRESATNFAPMSRVKRQHVTRISSYGMSVPNTGTGTCCRAATGVGAVTQR